MFFRGPPIDGEKRSKLNFLSEPSISTSKRKKRDAVIFFKLFWCASKG